MATRDRREYNKQWHKANKDKVSERKRDWYQENRLARNAYSNQYRKSLRDLINDYKKGQACVRCGITDYRVLDFHHRDPSHAASAA